MWREETISNTNALKYLQKENQKVFETIFEGAPETWCLIIENISKSEQTKDEINENTLDT